MLKNSKIGIFLMIIFFLSACGSNGGENNSDGSADKKANNVHFNTSVTAIKNGTVTERAIKSVSIYTGTLSVKDLNTKQTKTYDWFASLNTDTFDLNSTTTITLAPSNYELTLLLTKGKTQYIGRKIQNIKDGDSLNIDFALSPVVGDVITGVRSMDKLMNFELKYDINDFYSLSSPNLSLGLGNDSMVNFKINPSTGFDKLLMNIPEGERIIKLKLFDGNKQVAKATETVLVEYGTDINIDIEPLKGDLSFDFNTDNNSFDINLTIPNELFESTGSIANTKSVIKILSSAKGKLETKEFNIIENNGTYQASLSFKSLELNSSVSVEIAFFNKEQNNKLAGKMTLVVPSLDQHKKVSASLGVYSKSGLGGNVLASLSMNIQNADGKALSGVLVHLDNEFIGHSNNNGYLSALLTKGIHYLTFEKGDKFIATKNLHIEPLQILNIFVKIDDDDDNNSGGSIHDHTNPFKIIVEGRSFTIKLNPNYDYNYDVDCNDDKIYETTSRTSKYTCKYTEPGTHTIAISGDYPSPQFNGDSAIIAIEQWGNIAWKSMNNAFGSTKNLKTIKTDIGPDLSNVTDLSGMFTYSSNFNADLSKWDVSNITKIDSMFAAAGKFNSDLSSWNVSNVTNMAAAFFAATAFNGDISNWNVFNVTDMRYMFYEAIAFNGDISKWNVFNVTNMHSMFYKAFAFSSDISNWNVFHAKDLNSMLRDTPNFINNNLSDWEVSNVTDHRNFSHRWGAGNTEPKWK